MGWEWLRYVDRLRFLQASGGSLPRPKSASRVSASRGSCLWCPVSIFELHKDGALAAVSLYMLNGSVSTSRSPLGVFTSYHTFSRSSMVLISSDRLEVKILMAPDDMGKLWVWRISWWLDTWKSRQLSRATRVKSDPGLLQLLITNCMSNVDQPPEHVGSHQSFEFTRYIRHHSRSKLHFQL